MIKCSTDTSTESGHFYIEHMNLNSGIFFFFNNTMWKINITAFMHLLNQ